MSGTPPTGTGRVTYLTHHPPWPPMNGGAVRETNLLRRLADRFAIDVVAVCRPGPHTRAVEVQRALGTSTVRYFADESRRDLRRRRWSRAAADMLADRDRAGPASRGVVHVEGGYLFPHVPSALHDRTCVVEHNIESQVLRLFTAVTGDRALVRVAARVERLETRAWRQAAVVVAVTEEDRAHIEERSGRRDVVVIQNGADHVPLAIPGPSGRGPWVLLFANWAYAPNADALVFTLDDIWPAVIRAAPQARLVVAGNGLTVAQRARCDTVQGVEVLGAVDDPSTLFRGAAVALCPLRTGGGIKVKVLEALRNACPVVTTPVGAQGITGANRHALTVASTPASLATETARLILDPILREHRSAAARLVGATLPTWADAANSLSHVWTRLEAHRVAV